LLDLQSKLSLIVPGNTPSRDKVEQALLIQLGWPADRNFETSADWQIMVRCK
jgi:hypothetical protein